jgi:hypothetical protein
MRESDMRNLLVVALLGAFATGCSFQTQTETPAQEQQAVAAPAVEPQQGNTPIEDLDPFVVMIGAERWTVILDRATEGAMAATDAAASERSDLYRADAALKRGAAQVIELRNWVCGAGLVTGADCNLPEWPAWTRELPTGDTPIGEIDRRSAWLSEVMDPFTTAACEAGRKASNDDMFCSVE